MTVVSSLIAEVRANVSEPSTVDEQFYDDDELLNYLNRSINDLCIDTDVNYSVYAYTIAGSSVGTVTSMTVGSVTTNIYLANHGLTTSDVIYVSGIVGDVSGLIDDDYFTVTYVDDNNFTLAVNTSGLTWTSGGTLIFMDKEYPFTTISASSNVKMLDLSYMVYRDDTWQEFLYDDLRKTTPLDHRSYTNNQIRRQTCMVYQDTIYLSKAPKIDDIIIVSGRWSTPQLTATTDAYPLGLVEEDASIKWMTAFAWLQQGKPDIATAWMSLYNERKKDIELKRKKMVQFTLPSALQVYKNQDSFIDLMYRVPTIQVT